jgi:archaellum component FlaC
MNQPYIIELIIMAAAAITAVTVVIIGIKKIAGFVKKVVHFFDDFIGEEERPGHPARPGFSSRIDKIETCMEKVNERLNTIDYKIDSIEKELQPNSGTSLRDAIIRIEARVDSLELNK